MPMTLTPSPAWASAVPKAERGRPVSRFQATCAFTLPMPARYAEIGSRTCDQEQPGRQPEHRQHRPAVLDVEDGDRRGEGDPCHDIEPLQHAQKVAALPGEQRPERHGDSSNGAIKSPKVMLKNGAPTEILSPVSTSRSQRIECPDEDGAAGNREDQVVQHQARLRARPAQTGRPHSNVGARNANSDERPADEEHENAKNEGAAARVDRRRHAPRSSTPERTRKVPSSDSEKVRIASSTVQIFSASRFSITSAECTQCGSGKPRHEARRFRPDPRTTSRPSRVRNRPSRSPWRCRASGRSRPPSVQGLTRARPGGIDPPFDQARRTAKAKRDRESRHSR